MIRWVRVVAACCLVAYGLFGASAVPSFDLPGVEVQEPSVAMKYQVNRVTKVVRDMSPIDRLWLQYIYSSAADVVKSDGETEPAAITTTDDLRQVHVAILKFIWKGMAANSPGKYEGLQEAIESVFKDTIGDEHRAFTPSLREKACEMFDAIAWAGLGKDG